MKEYRIFLLDQTGQISSRVELVCATDEEVREAATKILRPGQQAELWQLGRLVGRVTAERAA